jgi:hypothetical protein
VLYRENGSARRRGGCHDQGKRFVRTAVVAVAIPVSLVLVVAILLPALSQTAGELVISLEMSGPGATFSTVYELRTDGVLETRRYAPSGAIIERRQLDLAPADYDRYNDLLQAGGYSTATPENLRLATVEETIGRTMDLPHWRIRMHRSSSDVVFVEVPARYVLRYHPELAEVPYVSSAWELIEEFQGLWDASVKVEP